MIYEATEPIVLEGPSGHSLEFRPVQLRELFQLRTFVGKLSDSIIGMMSANAAEFAAVKTDQSMDPKSGRVTRMQQDKSAVDFDTLTKYEDKKKKAVEQLLELFLDPKNTQVILKLIRNSARLEPDQNCEFPGMEGTLTDWSNNLDSSQYSTLFGCFIDANIGAFNPLMNRLGMHLGSQPEEELQENSTTEESRSDE